MAIYEGKVLNKRGTFFLKTVEADSMDDAIEQLRKMYPFGKFNLHVTLRSFDNLPDCPYCGMKIYPDRHTCYIKIHEDMEDVSL